ncbi:putative f-box domain protein [Mycena sanguinolenta]|uniref:Putative f-box domain protein n=1 Tax=Mycena sanguinolenta TaxID=230812 RepID=A0A8H6Z0Y9_9AGAR|nr:putative f-box domain protein [Mycena sanguinolenta]
MPTTQDQVIATPELLELILTQLPMRSLLVTAPLVSKTWQATTLTPTLQRALFFLPDPSSPPVQNPLLAELFPPFFVEEPDDDNSRTWSQPGSATSIMAMPWAKAPDAFKRADASWRRMLVTQPLAQTMAITETRSTRGGRSQRYAVLKLEALTMGVLYDLAVRFIDRQSSSFCIHWHHTGSHGDLTLAVRYSLGCVRYSGRVWVDKQFKSEAGKVVKVDFGEWKPVSRR